MTDIAVQHENLCLHLKAIAIKISIAARCIETARHGLTALLKAFFQITLHQPEPVAVSAYLVFGIDGCNRIFIVHD